MARCIIIIKFEFSICLLIRFAELQLRDRAAAEDAVQEALAAA